ncbi:unnamed protein product [Rotaria socialis]|uniref:EF-hand domain-containing protein n=1 Tax=Rotaria socialis TaxID=392032 RepID=A0A817QP35_9BILA|nr:unnamed protein product [Rotaria socialis]CAF3217174.1 unnamed protein product [Rotaria socialis]CAF3741361.1 unnamed protein product [Rotaria socialis]CAF3787424.1 unnamed protein product [Rotaria socialis]
MGNKQVKISGPTKVCKQHIDILECVTKLSEQEIQEWHAEFLHDCPSGKLSKDKFKECQRQYCRPEKADFFCNYIFNTYASNGNNDRNGSKVTNNRKETTMQRETKMQNYCAMCVDQNSIGDDSLNFADFIIAVSPGSQGKLEDRVSVLFDMYKKHSDEGIDEGELTVMITAMYDLVGATENKRNSDPKKVAKKIMKDCDKDGDNKLSKEEAIDKCHSHHFIRHLLAPYDEEDVRK